MVLCGGCHLWWHHKPLEAIEWWRGKVGEQAADTLRLLAGRPRRTDLILVALALEAERAKLLGG